MSNDAYKSGAADVAVVLLLLRCHPLLPLRPILHRIGPTKRQHHLMMLRRSLPTPEATLSTSSPTSQSSGYAEALIPRDTEENHAHQSYQPPIMRLVFHDCVGGCDGCVDLSKGENNAVGFPMRRLQDACPGLSRADCWALAAVTTAQELNGAGVQFDLEHVGRRDCPNGDAMGNARDSVDQPSAMLATGDLLDFFDAEFGFDAKETVALMGAHTLGSLANGRSGFNGQWVTRVRTLDNQFYRFLTDGNGGSTTEYDHTNEGNTNGLFLWKRRANVFQGRKPLVMLDVDMALAHDVSGHIVDQRTGEVSCVLETDGDAPICDDAAATLDQVVAYANDNQLWLEDFRDALNKMLANGYDTSNCNPGTLCVLP